MYTITSAAEGHVPVLMNMRSNSSAYRLDAQHDRALQF